MVQHHCMHNHGNCHLNTPGNKKTACIVSGYGEHSWMQQPLPEWPVTSHHQVWLSCHPCHGLGIYFLPQLPYQSLQDCKGGEVVVVGTFFCNHLSQFCNGSNHTYCKKPKKNKIDCHLLWAYNIPQSHYSKSKKTKRIVVCQNCYFSNKIGLLHHGNVITLSLWT